MYKKHIIGLEGEDIAVTYLLKNNYKILERNFYCYYGEIDIIAKHNNEYIFVEVKTRTNNNYGTPADSINFKKQKRILKSIEYYIYSKKLKDIYIRIDAIEVYKRENKFYINHIKNAIN